MLTITVPGEEFFDEESGEFLTKGDIKLDFEHSLLSLSKWELQYERPFLKEDEKTSEELFDYIKGMCLTPEVPSEVFERMTEQNFKDINAYIGKKATGTTFNDSKTPTNRSETISSELIYYWLVQMQIPFSVETWHLNRVITLIRIANVKAEKPKKLSKGELAAQRRKLNEERRRQYGTTG